MRKLILLFAAAFMLAACGGGTDEKKADEAKAEEKSDAGSVAGGLSELAKAAESMGDKTEELKKLTPLSTDALKSFLPETLLGIKRSRFNVANNMGFAVGEATYKKDDTTDLKVMIYDCAGEAGAAFYGMNFFMRMNMQQESEDGYTKTTEFMGSKAVESYKKYNNQYQLTFLSGERFLISVEGDNTGLDAVKDAAKSLDYDKLKSLK
jgi:hypothetical protein